MKRIQAIESLKAFVQNDDIINLIQWCDLFPIDSSWRRWTDHLGNFIKVRNNRTITSVENSAQQPKYIITDIFFKAHPFKIASLSKRAFIITRADEYFVWFLGKDNRLRLVTKRKTWTTNLSPLHLGADALLLVIPMLKSKVEGKIDILEIKDPTGKKFDRIYVTSWPTSINWLKQNKIEIQDLLEV